MCKIFCAILLVPFLSSAQVKLKVLDARSKAPVPFATIAFKQKNQGFNSDTAGNFILPSECYYDTLIISSVGYATVTIKAQDILTLNSVLLEEEIIELDTAIVRKRPNQTTLNFFKEKNEVPTYLTTLSFNYQAAQLFEAPGKNSLLKRIKLNLKETKQLFTFRLRFYDYNASTGAPGSDICSEVIELQTKSESVELDLGKYYITPSGSKFFIAIEWIISYENSYVWPVEKQRPAYFPLIACYVNQPCRIWVLNYRGEWTKYHCSYPKAMKIAVTVAY